MSKRVRTLETLGSLPYTTVDGGKWLKKALDPADIDVEVSGLPDTTTSPRCVLNYQFQGDIPVPHSTTYVANTTQSYDVDFYTFQNPVTLGMSVSRPAGTKNAASATFTWDANAKKLTLPPGYSYATVELFENPQIEGNTKNEKLNSLEAYCQRYRMIYGGVQCIPACSALFDSGTIEATQQIFSPEHKSINDNLTIQLWPATQAYRWLADDKVHQLQRFEKNDFPDEGTSIQNATSLYCRYKEGLYMPYKIRNPLMYEYKGSEQRFYTEAPFVITDTVYFVCAVPPAQGSEGSVGAGMSATESSRQCLAGVYNAETNALTCPTIPNGSTLTEIQFLCYTKTGIKFYICVALANLSSSQWTFPEVLPAYNSKNLWGLNIEGQSGPNVNFFYILGGDYQLNAANAEQAKKDLTVFDIPTHDANIGIICFRSIGLQASIRVIFRFGLEMMITAGGVYTPFKHKAPKYDQKALNSYVRAIHNMRDAFLGNAATPEGHALFAAHIAAIAADESGAYISNQGARWYGAVSV